MYKHTQMKRSKRDVAVSPAVGVTLMVAITIIIAAAAGIIFLDLADELRDPGATAGTTTEGDAIDRLFLPDDAVLVKISHVAGDDLHAEDMKLIIRSPGGTAEVVVPDTGIGVAFDPPEEYASNLGAADSVNVSDPEDILQEFDSNNRLPKILEPGEDIRIVVDGEEAGIDDGEGEIEVVIVERSSDTVVATHEFPASEF